ncbi:hypothetical protein SUDANB15_00358 [Streptomyces sp. enrichment culture]
MAEVNGDPGPTLTGLHVSRHHGRPDGCKSRPCSPWCTRARARRARAGCRLRCSGGHRPAPHRRGPGPRTSSGPGRQVRTKPWSGREKATLVVDGAPITTDRVRADEPYCSRKHRQHGTNVQVVARPDGAPLWFSRAAPGRTPDLTTARAHKTKRPPGGGSAPTQRTSTAPRRPGRRRTRSCAVLPAQHPTVAAPAFRAGTLKDGDAEGRGSRSAAREVRRRADPHGAGKLSENSAAHRGRAGLEDCDGVTDPREVLDVVVVRPPPHPGSHRAAGG